MCSKLITKQETQKRFPMWAFVCVFENPYTLSKECICFRIWQLDVWLVFGVWVRAKNRKKKPSVFLTHPFPHSADFSSLLCNHLYRLPPLRLSIIITIAARELWMLTYVVLGPLLKWLIQPFFLGEQSLPKIAEINCWTQHLSLFSLCIVDTNQPSVFLSVKRIGPKDSE